METELEFSEPFRAYLASLTPEEVGRVRYEPMYSDASEKYCHCLIFVAHGFGGQRDGNEAPYETVKRRLKEIGIYDKEKGATAITIALEYDSACTRWGTEATNAKIRTYLTEIRKIRDGSTDTGAAVIEMPRTAGIEKPIPRKRGKND